MTGDLLMTANILPTITNTYQLGSADYVWRDLYVGPGSINVDGIKLSNTGSGSLSITSASGATLDMGIVASVANSAALYANGAFTQANSGFAVANSASLYANGAFAAANVADAKAVTAGNYANSSFGVANSASLYANGAFAAANVADAKAVTAGDYANSSFGVANSASVYANGAFTQANSEPKAVTAGDYANSAFSVANTANDKAESAGAYANASFIAANSSGVYANSAYSSANSAGVYANSAFAAANGATSAGVYANSAFSRANNSLQLTGGTIAGNVTANSFIANTSVYSPIYYSPAGTTNLTLSDIGIVAINSGGQETKFGGGGIESIGVYSGSYGGNKISLNNETNVISNRYDTVKIQTGTDGSISNEWSFSNNTLIFPDSSVQLTAYQGYGLDNVARYTANSGASYANSAFLAANNASDAWVRTQANSAFIAANSAGVYANSAFAKANTTSGITYTVSNSSPGSAKAGDQWWSSDDDILYEYIYDGSSNVWIDISSSGWRYN